MSSSSTNTTTNTTNQKESSLINTNTNTNTNPIITGPPIPFSSLPLYKPDSFPSFSTSSTSANSNSNSISESNPSSTSKEGINPTAPYLNAWGLYGSNDQLGFLNRQTDDLVLEAVKSEVKVGKRVALDLGMGVQGDKPLFGRHVFKHHVYQKKPRIVHDDTWHCNTQSSTQWDGLRHFGYQEAARFYNNTTVEDIANSPTVLGTQNTAKRGGIMGRGILIDFHSWWSSPSSPGYETVMTETRGKGFRPFERSPIKLRWLKAALDHQGTKIKWGDILFVRSGFMEAYANIPAETLQVLHDFHPNPPTLGGVEITEELLEWIWNHFSAVVGDQPGFEQIPMEKPISGHEVLLAGWGCPIGEMFDLDELSRVCVEQKRWSFFLSSQVVNVEGGVASPPCAVAMF